MAIVTRCIGLPLLAPALVATLLSATPARAQSASSWIGVKVIPKHKVVLKIGRQVVDTGGRHHVYTVERADGPWLWVVAGERKGWVKAHDVFTLDQALDYCGRTLQSNPATSWA